MKEEITKEELEKKWWHRMVKVLIWFLSIFGSISFLRIDDFYIAEFSDLIGWIVMFLIITGVLFFVFSFIYYKVILYIVYGKNKNISSFKPLDSRLKVFLIVLFFGLVMVIIVAAISLMEEPNELPIMDYNRPEGLENLKTRPEGIDLKTR